MSDRDRKTGLKLQFRKERMEAARAAVPLHPLQARRFFEGLILRVDAEGCDHTKMGAEELARRLGIKGDDFFDWLDQNGGYCDCEIVENVYPEWEHMQQSSL